MNRYVAAQLRELDTKHGVERLTIGCAYFRCACCELRMSGRETDGAVRIKEAEAEPAVIRFVCRFCSYGQDWIGEIVRRARMSPLEWAVELSPKDAVARYSLADWLMENGRELESRFHRIVADRLLRSSE